MKRLQIDLTEQETEQITALAEKHGHKLKPFIEYLLRLQLGTAPPPTAKPVQIPLKDEPAREEPKEEQTKVEPVQAQPTKEIRVKIEPKKEEPKEITHKRVEQAHKVGRFANFVEFNGTNILYNGSCYMARVKDVNQYRYTLQEIKDLVSKYSRYV